MIDAVVFDLDGVLVDSEPVWEDIRRTYVAAHGGRWLDEAQDQLMGMSTSEWAAYLSRDLGVGRTRDQVADDVIGEMAQRYRGGVPVLPGAVGAVERMAARWPIGLASSSPRRLIDVVLGELGLATRFTTSVSTEEVDRGKPAPDVYLTVAEQLGVAPARCAAIEDSANGLRSATHAGLTVVAVPRPSYPPEPGLLDAATAVLDSLDELTVALVERLGDSL